jgi:hypothetical protein
LRATLLAGRIGALLAERAIASAPLAQASAKSGRSLAREAGILIFRVMGIIYKFSFSETERVKFSV